MLLFNRSSHLETLNANHSQFFTPVMQSEAVQQRLHTKFMSMQGFAEKTLMMNGLFSKTNTSVFRHIKSDFLENEMLGIERTVL